MCYFTSNEGYIKYFDDGGKNMAFVTDDKEIWNVVKKILKLKFTVNPVRDDKYILTKLKIFKKINVTTFTNNVVPEEKNHYICISAIDIDSVLKIDKRTYPQAYLEQCKYKLKKTRPANLLILKLLIIIVIVKMEIILLHLNIHKNVPKILPRLFITF